MMARLQRLVRQLLRRSPAPRYPLTVERVFKSGRRLSITFASPESVDNFLTTIDEELAKPSGFSAPMTLQHPDHDPRIEHERPPLLPPLAIQLAALRQRTRDRAGLADDDDPDQERDRRLVWWFRRQRDQAD